MKRLVNDNNSDCNNYSYRERHGNRRHVRPRADVSARYICDRKGNCDWSTRTAEGSLEPSARGGAGTALDRVYFGRCSEHLTGDFIVVASLPQLNEVAPQRSVRHTASSSLVEYVRWLLGKGTDPTRGPAPQDG